MAWPKTPLTSYVAGAAPPIKAADLNSFQSAINGIINATYSHLAMEIDGTGGAVVAPVAGTCKVSASGGAASAPMTVQTWGRAFKEHIAFGEARVNDLGQVIGGINVKTEPGGLGGADHPSAGVYYLTFHGAPTNLARCRAAVASRQNIAPRTIDVDAFTLRGADLLAVVRIWDEANNPVDAWFDLEIKGG